jgi:hypothetical protein
MLHYVSANQLVLWSHHALNPAWGSAGIRRAPRARPKNPERARRWRTWAATRLDGGSQACLRWTCSCGGSAEAGEGSVQDPRERRNCRA